MTLERLYELIIYKLVYGSLRVDKELGSYRGISIYYGVHSSIWIDTVALEHYGESYTLITPETDILITKYENSHEC